MTQNMSPPHKNLILTQVVCPKCKGKALFRSQRKETYQLRQQDKGFVSCVLCGLSKPTHLSELKYDYAITIKNRVLVARSIEELKKIYLYFKERKKHLDEPDFDYPKVFYENRALVVERIEALLNKEQAL